MDVLNNVLDLSSQMEPDTMELETVTFATLALMDANHALTHLELFAKSANQDSSNLTLELLMLPVFKVINADLANMEMLATLNVLTVIHLALNANSRQLTVLLVPITSIGTHSVLISLPVLPHVMRTISGLMTLGLDLMEEQASRLAISVKMETL